MPHSSTSRTRQNQAIIVMLRGVFKLNHSKNTKTLSVMGIAQDMSIIWMTRRRFMKVKYFKGFTTAMLRSNTKLHKFGADAYMNSHLIKCIPWESRPCGSHPLPISQKKSDGTAIIPTKKSATANETMKAFVFVRSRCFLQTMKMTNPFLAIVRIERDQTRIQNLFSIL